MRLLYPCDPFDRKIPDEAYADEFQAAQAIGLSCLLYSAEDFQSGEFKPRPAINAGDVILYRGWMLTPDEYFALHAAVVSRGGEPFVSTEQYRLCHYLPEWYQTCRDFTPETVFLTEDADFGSVLGPLGWSAYFVKDYVKSLTTSRGSVARNPQEVAEVVSLIKQFRGQLEGGVCVRKFESLDTESEERYFAINGKAHARTGDPPAIAQDIANRINSPFFSIDLVRRDDGQLLLIELGDGQVSDRKKWEATEFVHLFSA